MSSSKPCEGCAFTEGTEANLCPYNRLKGELCLLGGVPFYCHHDIDWRSPQTHKKKSRQEVRAIKVCAGWRREVAELAATGYFKTERAEKKANGELGLGALETFVHGFACKKAMAKRIVHRVVCALAKMRNQARSAHG
jgi:hypothetical protein